MATRITRRDLLAGGAAAGVSLGLGDLGFLSSLRPVSAEEAAIDPKVVRLDPSIEPLVRLIEQTPQDKVLEAVAEQIRKGASYQDIVAAVLLAGVRNVEPRPSVGFKFHAVLVVNSAHIASMASPPEHRWLPIFWTIDHFKSAQARDDRERGWTMPPVDESAVPKPHQAREAFVAAMDNWDESAADAAVASLARHAGASEVFEMFFRYGARDFRSIGHKAIFVANSWRTLQSIGWQHAEPVLRSLAYALLMHEGSNPAQRDEEADRPFRNNTELVKSIRSDWLDGNTDDGAVEQLLGTLRKEGPTEVCEQIVSMLNSGVSPQSIWDAQLVYAGELLMRQPAIVPLHAVTTSNATRFAYEASGDDETRRLLMLQNGAFLTLFRGAAGNRGDVKDITIDALNTEERAEGLTTEQIFAELGKNPMEAARHVKQFLSGPDKARELIDAARVLVFLKGNDAHDYKFSSAVLEDYYHVSPTWRNTFLASNVFQLQHSGRADNGLVERTRAALQS
jgi:hypothetical protein